MSGAGLMPTSTESVSFSNIAATTSAFQLRGGKYEISALGTFGGGSVKFQALGPDGATFISPSAGTDFTAAGEAVLDLPPGQYRFTIATATAVYAAACRIPS
jgi:hypothetical protein